MSLSQIILVCNWFLEGELKGKLISFKNNKAALIVSSLILLHFIGLIYTSDFDYAFKDIRIKGPLLILPLILSTSKPLSQKVIDAILKFFVVAIIVGTIVGMLILSGFVHRQVVDIRNVSIFISHIRFALLICVTLFISGYYFYHSTKLTSKLLWIAIALWLITFLVLTESMTGLSAFCFTVFVISIYSIFKSKIKAIKYSGIFLIVLIGIFVFYVSNQLTKATPEAEKIDFSKLEQTTPRGNVYEHNLDNKLTENGHFIRIYVCNKELEESWNKRSEMKYSEKDLKGNDISATLIRFLASKGLRKDADAVNALSSDEIKLVEKGVANVTYQNLSSIDRRLHEIAWELDEYKTTGDPNGHSLTQRFEFWKAAVGIMKENFVFGVGTGDIQKAFELQYDKMNSPL